MIRLKIKYSFLFLSGILFLLGANLDAEAKSPKRGVSENQFSVGCQLRALEPGVGWYYNWGNTPGAGYKDQIINFEEMEFVPMCWNANYNAQAIRDYVTQHPNTHYLLGFNEPNFKHQANMTPAEAAAEWPKLQALAKELNLKLVAPALNYSPDAPYTDPLKWMDEFVAIVGNDAFDFTAVHSYGGAGVIKKISTDFHERYGKDVWVTEFCYWPGEQTGVSVTPDAQINSMVESLEWLESTDWIFRYAWFKPIGASNAANSPNYGLLEAQKGLEQSFLTPQGNVYVYFPDASSSNLHEIDTDINPMLFSSRRGCSINSSNDEEAFPLEISSFISGAFLDYRFNVPEQGNYTLSLKVGGYGEPQRFNPCIGLHLIENGEESETLHEATCFSLPNHDTQYALQQFQIVLKAGEQTIRLRDHAPYQASGIRISSLRLSSAANVNAFNETPEGKVDVYSPTGIKVLQQVSPKEAQKLLSSGLYLIGKEKILIQK